MKDILEIINLPGSAIDFIGGQFKYLHEVGGYRMHLICSPGDGIIEFCEENDVRFFPVQLNRQIALVQDIKSLISICRYIRRERIDVVIAHQPKGRLLGMLACLIMGVRYRVIFSHGILYETMTGLRRKLIMFFEKFVSSIAGRVVCVSKFVQERRLDDHIDKPYKQVILGHGSCNGIDTINKFNPELVSVHEIQRLKETYKICDNDFVIGFCGRLVRDKGVVELIDAFQQIIDDKKNKSIKLLIVGQFEKRDSLPMEIIDFITSDPNIIFTGPVPYEKIQQIYMLMNVLVLPTHREGFGMVAIEASAMERPVIVSNYTGCAETIIDGETGLYIDKSPESIKLAIEKCFDTNFSRKLGANGRNFVMTNFEHTKVRKYMLDFLNVYCKEVE